mmetsp:Transcript_3775/g.3886  ORF Transcript_3775/g.3886 Transcript_3775/m.3886 type:complete len:474 (-) Transcript_3775:90-1511(-)
MIDSQAVNIQQVTLESSIQPKPVNCVPDAIQTARVSLGLCPTCGIQTQVQDKNGNFQPLSNAGWVHKSRCLLCNPLPKKQPTPIRRSENEADCFISLRRGSDMSHISSLHSLTDDDSTFYRGTKDSSTPMRHFNKSSIRNEDDQGGAYDLQHVLIEHPISHSNLQERNVDENEQKNSQQNLDIPVRTPMDIQNADLKFQEGWDYYMGDHHKSIDRKRGESLIIKAMHDGSFIARGFCQVEGWGNESKNRLKAYVAFCQLDNPAKIAESVVANAVALKGYCFRKGYGTDPSKDDALRCFSLAANQYKHSWSMAMLALYRAEGCGAENDNIRKFTLYKQSADIGYVKAMYNVAELYANGVGVKRNNDEAMVWYCRAADKGYKRALQKAQQRVATEVENIEEVHCTSNGKLDSSADIGSKPDRRKFFKRMGSGSRKSKGRDISQKSIDGSFKSRETAKISNKGHYNNSSTLSLFNT